MYYKKLEEDLIRIFGEKVYKISLDGGFTCPNRDGTLSDKGCIFCLNGSGDFTPSCQLSLRDQIDRSIALVHAKTKSNRYIAYFQRYTNTYAPLNYLQTLYTQAISFPEICGLSIATRPDCLSADTVSLLRDLNSIKPVWVELGLQSIHPASLSYIRSGFTLDDYDRSLSLLKKAGIYTIVHMIIGLPGESQADMVKTARYIGQSGADGIKLQLLHVLKGTDLANDYENHFFQTLTMEEYIMIVENCLRVLPKNVCIHRLTGDGNRQTLIAPVWSLDKKRVLSSLYNCFLQDDLEQGSLL